MQNFASLSTFCCFFLNSWILPTKVMRPEYDLKWAWILRPSRGLHPHKYATKYNNTIAVYYHTVSFHQARFDESAKLHKKPINFMRTE